MISKYLNTIFVVSLPILTSTCFASEPPILETLNEKHVQEMLKGSSVEDPAYLNDLCDGIYENIKNNLLSKNNISEDECSFDDNDADSEELWYIPQKIRNIKHLAYQLIDEWCNLIRKVGLEDRYKTYPFLYLCEKALCDDHMNFRVFEEILFAYKNLGYDSFEKLATDFVLISNSDDETLKREAILRQFLVENIEDWPDTPDLDEHLYYTGLDESNPECWVSLYFKESELNSIIHYSEFKKFLDKVMICYK